MPSIALTETKIRILKHELQRYFVGTVKSSHLSEAIAAAVGMRTYAALRARLKECGSKNPPVLEISEEAFLARLEALGAEVLPADREYGVGPLSYRGDGLIRYEEPYQPPEIDWSSYDAEQDRLLADFYDRFEQELLSIRSLKR